MVERFSGGMPEGKARVIAQKPIGRLGRPKEIAAAVLWLGSKEAAFTTCGWWSDYWYQLNIIDFVNPYL